MKEKYNHQEIEKKWQKEWLKQSIYRTDDESKKPKSYVLIEFPYPSGERLHVGHARSYCALDAVARLQRMKGFNVLFPMGWDAFGLPAENYAIKTGTHPSISVAKNIQNAKNQLISLGLSFDWDREIDTTDPKYYKWTQWIFLQLFKAGLAYRREIPVNWCPSCKINLANEEVIAGNCERCGHSTERRRQKQWLLRITEYADRLLLDLNDVDYREDIKQQQVNWIGRKEGANISYEVDGTTEKIICFTTRPDTNFGASFIALAPEHALVKKITTDHCKKDVENYVSNVSKKSELERLSAVREKTGVFTGRDAINKLNGEKFPIYIADFVLPDVGSGAVVGVPGHDIRDYGFAVKFGLPVKRVVALKKGQDFPINSVKDVYEGDGFAVNSGFLDGLETPSAKEKVVAYIENNGFGERAVAYHLRDWVFSRQHYWGEPIPIIHCEKCGEVPVPESDLPVELPYVEKYEPTGTGESPLAAVEEWVKVKCPKCGGLGKRETDTMPNWAGSSWYFLRYIDPKNDKMFAGREKLEKWLPVDWYNGGMEHTTLHLLYSRFWHKFLFDQGYVPTKEPYAKRTSHGVVLGPDNQKMSKSRGNIITPDDIVSTYGADTLRIYMMFIGPFEHTVAWSAESLVGVHRFVKKAWALADFVIKSKKKKSDERVEKAVFKLIKNTEKGLENMKFNTVISTMMETINFLVDHKEKMGIGSLKNLMICMAPVAPHLAEEVWHLLQEKASIHSVPWTNISDDLVQEDEITVIVQVNGRLRGTIQVPAAKIGDEHLVCETALAQLELPRKYDIDRNTAFKYVLGRVLNFIPR